MNTPWLDNQPDGLVCINKLCYTYKGEMPENCEITIPEKITAIGEYAFNYQNNLKTVTIPDGVSSIGNCAFVACSNLATVTIPESVTSISDRAFFNCDKLTITGHKGSYAEQYAKKANIPFTALETDNEDIFIGDVNDDGSISATDIAALCRYILRDEEAVINKANSDLNSDGTIDAMDLLVLKNIILKAINYSERRK